MTPAPAYRSSDWVLLFLVLAVAGGTRAYYVLEYTGSGHDHQDHIPHVQGPMDGGHYLNSMVRSAGMTPDAGALRKTDIDTIIENLKKEGSIAGFRGPAPLSASDDETTAHVAPGYPVFRWLVEMGVAQIDSEHFQPQPTVIWIQVALGTLAAGFYFAVGRRAFHSPFIGTVAGLLCALNPFWIINVAELGDGVLTSFMLGLCLALGVKAGQRGGLLTSLLFGIFLAALSLVRAAMLPFAFVSLMWFLLRSRQLQGGWMFAVLAFLGFGLGSSAWAIRNWQIYEQPVPVVSSMYWHFWVGNNPMADGNPPPPHTQVTLEQANYNAMYHPPEGGAEPRSDLQFLAQLGKERTDQIRTTQSQPAQYGKLAPLVLDEVRANPGKTVTRRLVAAKGFFFGVPSTPNQLLTTTSLPPDDDRWKCCRDYLPTVLFGVLVGMLLLALVGWRWSALWAWSSMPLSLAIFWIPIPYVLTYPDPMHGSRLPLDGPLMVLAAVAICGVIPFVSIRLLRGERAMPIEPPPPPTY